MNIWEIEPNRVNLWIDDLPVIVNRNNILGNLCGYVGIPFRHPLFGKEYDHDILSKEIPIPFMNAKSIFKQNDTPVYIFFTCHGGLTWSGSRPGCDQPYPDNYWWFGFDCGHAFDFSPYLDHSYINSKYRDLNYVVSECKSLAKQLKQWM